MNHHQDNSLANERGFTLIEVLMALLILSIGLLGIAGMQIASINGNADSRDFTEASVAAQDQIEALMGTPFADIADGTQVSNGYTVTWTVSAQDFNSDGSDDAKELLVTVVDPLGKQRVAVKCMITSGL